MKEWAWLKGKKWTGIVTVIGLAGIALLALSHFWPSTAAVTSPQTETETIARQTEQRLTELIRRMDGVGNCRVMVTLQNGGESVYATDEKNNTTYTQDGTPASVSSESETVHTDGGGGLLLTEMQPQIRGVVVVCDGGDNEAVRRQVTEAVTVALDISSKRVCVTKSS